MSRKKDKVYASSLITSDILLGTPNGPVRIYIDENNRLSVDLEDNSNQTKSVKLDPGNNKVVVGNVDFNDGSTIASANNIGIPDNVATLTNGKLSSDVLPDTVLDSTTLDSALNTRGTITTANFGNKFDERFDTKGAVTDLNVASKISQNLPASVITTTNFETQLGFSDRFDTAFSGKNPITTTNFGTNFDTAFTGKNPVTTGTGGNFDTLFDGRNPITTTNFGTNFDTAFTSKNPVTTGTGGNFDTLFAGKNPITSDNFGSTFDTAFAGKNPITTTNFGTNFDTAFSGKNAITTTNFGTNFDTAFTGKNAITTANFETQLAFSDRFDTAFTSKNPITTTNFGSTFDTAFAGKNPITTANFGTNFDTAFGGKNPVTTGTGGNFDTLFDGRNPITTTNFGSTFDTAFAGKNPVTDTNFSSKFNTEFGSNVPTGYNSWSDLATAATNGNTTRGYFNEYGILDITKAPDGLKNANVFSDTRWQAVSGSARDAIFSGSSAYDDLGNLDFSVSNGSISLSRGNRGTASTSISKTSLGLESVENYSLAQIKSSTFGDTSFITVQSTANAANGTANTVRGFFDNSSTPQLNPSNTPNNLKNSNISLSLTNGSLSLTNGGGSAVTFTKSTVGLGNVANEDPATIRSGITVDDAGILQGIGTSGIAVKNSLITKTSIGLGNVENKSSSAIRGEITVNTTTGKLEGIGTPDVIVNNNLVTKSSIGLGNVANESPATIRSGITVDSSGVLQGIGTDGIAVKNSLITKTSLGLGSVENYSLAQIKTATFTDSNFTSISNRFTGGILNTANLPTIGLSKLDTSVTQSLAKADTVNSFFTNNLLNSANAPSDYASIKTNASDAISKFQNGLLKTDVLPQDPNGIDFSDSKVVLGRKLGAYTYSGTAYEVIDSYSDIEVVTGSGIPDISLTRTGTSAGVKGKISFKGFDGTYSTRNVGAGTWNPITKQWSSTVLVPNIPNYGERAFIQSYQDANGGAKLSFATGQAGYFNSSTSIGASYSPVERMIIDQDGNVSIGTTTTGTYKLDVRGSTYIEPTLNKDTLYLERNGGSASIKAVDSHLIMDSNTDFAAINYYTNQNVSLCYGGARVAIGDTTNPSNKLDVRENRSLNYVAFFKNSHDDGHGIRIHAGIARTGTSIPAKKLIEFAEHNGTALGSINYSTSNSITYGNFTGFHESNTVSTSLQEIPFGSIIKVINSYLSGSNKEGQPLYDCSLTLSEKEKAVFGVYGGYVEEDDKHHILSLGDGQILVCSEGGNIEIGDYICSSNTEGMGMKQDDDLLHNYTVAKANENVDWSNESVTSKLINCTYHCG